MFGHFFFEVWLQCSNQCHSSCVETTREVEVPLLRSIGVCCLILACSLTCEHNWLTLKASHQRYRHVKPFSTSWQTELTLIQLNISSNFNRYFRVKLFWRQVYPHGKGSIAKNFLSDFEGLQYKPLAHVYSFLSFLASLYQRYGLSIRLFLGKHVHSPTAPEHYLIAPSTAVYCRIYAHSAILLHIDMFTSNRALATHGYSFFCPSSRRTRMFCKFTRFKYHRPKNSVGAFPYFFSSCIFFTTLL